MLTLVDRLLTLLVGTFLPIAIVLGVAVVCLLLVAMARQQKSLWLRSECVGLALTLACLASGFCAWLGEFRAISSPDDTGPQVPVTLAMLITTFALGAARALRAMGVPWLVIAVLAWGIAVFGL